MGYTLCVLGVRVTEPLDPSLTQVVGRMRYHGDRYNIGRARQP